MQMVSIKRLFLLDLRLNMTTLLHRACGRIGFQTLLVRVSSQTWSIVQQSMMIVDIIVF